MKIKEKKMNDPKLMCKECNLPVTGIEVLGKQFLMIQCRACGRFSFITPDVLTSLGWTEFQKVEETEA